MFESLSTRLQDVFRTLRGESKLTPENIEAALGNFFTVENLLALREVALRQVAQEVEAKRLVVEAPLGTRTERVAAEVPKAVGERLLALVRPQPSSQRLVRRAWRSSWSSSSPRSWTETPRSRLR